MQSRAISFILVGATVLAGAACITEPSAPACAPVSLSTTSTNGDTVTLNTGLRYIDLEPGRGPAAEWCVGGLSIHYTEYLLDGTRIESSKDLDIPVVFQAGIGDLIEGFEQGAVGMRSEGVRRLIVPPHLAYGNQVRRNSSGQVIVPANATLVYDIELVAILIGGVPILPQ